MKTIRIKVDGNQVQAYQFWNPQGGGDVDPTQGEKITWKHLGGGTSEAFIVTFENVIANQPGWPFTPQVTDQRLRVPKGTPTKVELDPAAARYWKYKVEVEGNRNYQPHDPMIIIRGGKQLAPIVYAFIVGAVVGALLTLALLPSGA